MNLYLDEYRAGIRRERRQRVALWCLVIAFTLALGLAGGMEVASRQPQAAVQQ